MRSETINSDNLAEVEWADDFFKFCDFVGFSVDGEVVASDFVCCSFNKIDWYWGLFVGCNFISCNFTDCSFAGASFPGTRFVDCKILNCVFIKNNLGTDCDFSETTVYGCSVENTTGFVPIAKS